jgi:pyruvate dehydrogenase E1 component alpha subunit
VNTGSILSREHGLHLLTQMLRIRRFEEKTVELYQLEKIRGFLHVYIGEEAVAVGVMQHIDREDAIVAGYREHGHALVKGVSARTIMAEMYGKQEGCSGGRGGSMHLFCAEQRFFGGNAIVAGGIPLAVGLALADAMQGRRRVTACFFGDGAVAEGEFHESLNLAALWKLPVLFICENNMYAMGTRIDRHSAEIDLARRAASYGVRSQRVDGMNVLAVEEAARHACDYVRAGEGPCFLELETYRFRAHSMFDAQLYRDKEEVEQWKERDPIQSLERLLREHRLLDDSDLERIEADVRREVEDAEQFAEAGTWEPVESLLRHVYTEVRA